MNFFELVAESETLKEIDVIYNNISEVPSSELSAVFSFDAERYKLQVSGCV